MRMIGTVTAEPPARRFCDYLLTRGIAAHAEEGQGGWQIWIENDDQLDAGRAELQQFASAPDDARYNSATDAKRIRAEADRASQRRRKNYKDVRTSGIFNSAGRGAIPVTITVIAISVALAALMKFGSDPNSPIYRALLFVDVGRFGDDDVLSRFVMFTDIARGQIWRFITPIFIHYGPMHLIFNMMWMLDLGRRIEPVKGGARLAIGILIIALISCSAEALWAALDLTGNAYPLSAFGGMSGVVAGLFGYAWMCGYFRPYERIAVTQSEAGFMLGWLVICSFGIVGPIANAAHWGGLLTGMIIGAAPSVLKKLK